MPASDPSTDPPTDRADRRAGTLLPWSPLLFLAAAIPLILVGLRRGRGQFDEEVFHLPAIRRFASQIGRGGIDLSDYLSATTPGYHLLLAAVVRWVGDSLILLKLVSAAFTMALLALLERSVGGRLAVARLPDLEPSPAAQRLATLALIAPVLGSMYVFVPGVWLQPDNAGWLGVLVMLLLALRPRWDHWSLIAGGAIMLALVWMRQSHLWAAGVLWAAAWIGGASRTPPNRPTPAARSIGYDLGSSIAWMIRPTRGRFIRLGLAVAATLPAIASLAWLARMWGGLTPPTFRAQHGGGWNPATPALAMSLMAIFSGFFFAWVWPGVVRLWRQRRSGGWLIILACVLIGLLAAAVPETTFKYEPRATGLWNAVKAMDQRGLSLGGRTSPLLLVLAPLGMIAAAGWLAQLPRRRAWIHGLAMAGFVAAQSANTNAWQRYIEPFLLLQMALMAADLAARHSPPSPAPADPPHRSGGARGRWLGPALLGALGAALTALTIAREPVFVKDWPDHPLARPVDRPPAGP